MCLCVLLMLFNILKLLDCRMARLALHFKIGFALSNCNFLIVCRFTAGKVFDFQLDKTWKDFLKYD